MIRDNIFPAGRYRIAPETDELAAQRVSEATGFSMSGLTFFVFSSVQQFVKALEEGADFRITKQKMIANGGAWSKLWQLDGVAKNCSCWTFYVWQTQQEVTVTTVTLGTLGRIPESKKKEFDEIKGE